MSTANRRGVATLAAVTIALAAGALVAPRADLFAASAVAAVAVFLLLSRGLASTGGRPDRARRLERLVLGGVASAGALLMFQNVLVHDALWYYTYLRSAMVQGNMEMYGEFVLKNPFGMYLPPPGTPIIHLGTALTETPAALLVRPLALLLDAWNVLPGGDGYGPLETFAVTATSAALALGGVALLHRVGRAACGGGASAVAHVVFLFASPLAFFAFYWPGYPHAASVFLAALFVLVWMRRDRSSPRSVRHLLLLGWLIGMLALVHPQDVLYGVLPAIDALLCAVARARAGRVASALRGFVRDGTVLTAGAIAGFAPQLVAWKLTSGRFLPHVYGELGDPFLWTSPALVDVLVSGYNGLLTWTPLSLVAIAGLVLLARRDRRLAWGLATILVTQWWAIASYGYWWGGASFGARYFLSAYPALAIGLAAAFGWCARRVGLAATGAAAMPFVVWNLMLMAQFRMEWIPHNLRPDFPGVLARQVATPIDEMAAGLFGSIGWNRVLLIDSLQATLAAENPLGVAACLALATLAMGALYVWIARLALPGAAPRLSAASVRGTIGLALSTSVVATAVVAATASGHGRTLLAMQGPEEPIRLEPDSTRIVPLQSADSEPTEEWPTRVVKSAASPMENSERRLDVVHFLYDAQERRDGEVIASLRIVGDSCGFDEHLLRAGYETAETAPRRVEISGEMNHDASRPHRVQTWWQDDGSRQHYFGHAFGSSWILPDGCEPRSLLVRSSPGRGSIELREIAVSTRAGNLP